MKTMDARTLETTRRDLDHRIGIHTPCRESTAEAKQVAKSGWWQVTLATLLNNAAAGIDRDRIRIGSF